MIYRDLSSHVRAHAREARVNARASNRTAGGGRVLSWGESVGPLAPTLTAGGAPNAPGRLRAGGAWLRAGLDASE